MKHKKACPFCSKSHPDIHFTKEHILRDKFNSLFPETPNFTTWENKTRNSSGGFDFKPIVIPQGPFDGTVNSICNECNAGWMNKLENQAESSLVDLFHGHQRFPSAENLEVLAFWAAKTAAVNALKHRDNFPGIPIEHYSMMRTGLKPPPLTCIWYCHTAFNQNTYLRYFRAGLPGKPESTFHISTINIGHALFSIIGPSSHEMYEALIPEITLRDMLHGRIWPDGANRFRPSITIQDNAHLKRVGEMMAPYS